MACRSDRPSIPEAQVKGDCLLKGRVQCPHPPLPPSDPPGSQIPFPSGYKYSSCKRREGQAHQFGWQSPWGRRVQVSAEREQWSQEACWGHQIPGCSHSLELPIFSPELSSPKVSFLGAVAPLNHLPPLCLRSSCVNAIRFRHQLVRLLVCRRAGKFPRGQPTPEPLQSWWADPPCRPAESLH